MLQEKLYIIHGTGTDKVGLVKNITMPLAEINGNIVDLRQDVMHGLFTIYLVVDLTEANVNAEEFRGIVTRIAEQTDMALSVDKYTPIARDPGKKNILLILVGSDKPGIAAKISETLSKYRINIEFSQMIARERVFLMELLIDISHCTLPFSNLHNVLKQSMRSMDITALIQDKDVFNKKKRIIIFNGNSSFLPPELQHEILSQTGIGRDELKRAYEEDPAEQRPVTAYGLLDGLPLQVLENIFHSVSAAPGTQELLQTLKIMGYKIALVSPAFMPLLEKIKDMLAIDYCFGFPLPINDDTRSLSREMLDDQATVPRETQIRDILCRKEGVSPEDITTLGNKGGGSLLCPGIQLEFDLKLILDYYNQHILSKENILGLLGAFGLPRTDIAAT